MPLFLVVAPDPTALPGYEATVKTVFAENFIPISPNVWAVSSPGIAKDVAIKILGEDVTPSAATPIVVAVSGYWGTAPNSVWEWFALKSLTAHGTK